MEILRDLLVFIHLLGMAIIIGSYFANPVSYTHLTLPTKA